jgi:hypothetical protein
VLGASAASCLPDTRRRGTSTQSRAGGCNRRESGRAWAWAWAWARAWMWLGQWVVDGSDDDGDDDSDGDDSDAGDSDDDEDVDMTSESSSEGNVRYRLHNFKLGQVLCKRGIAAALPGRVGGLAGCDRLDVGAVRALLWPRRPRR